MAKDIVVPQLGESVTEATIAKWMKKVGDSVAQDEILLELETDKVTLEVNAPVAGRLAEITAQEGATVEVGAIVGRLAEAGEAVSAKAPTAKPEPAKPAAAATAPAPSAETGKPAVGPSGPVPDLTRKISDEQRAQARPTMGARHEAGAPPEGERATGVDAPEDEALSPSVRKLMEENEVVAGEIAGSGPGGRITKGDVLDYIGKEVKKGAGEPSSDPKNAPAEQPGAVEPEPRTSPAPSAPPPPAPSEAAPAQAASQPAAKQAVPSRPAPVVRPVEGDGATPREERVRMSRLRKRIAERLKQSQNTAAMLTTFNEADMSAVIAVRKQYRDIFEKKHGIKLGFMSFFVKAAIVALKEIPAVNAEIDGEDIVYKNFYDIGVAVGIDQGLVVPVLRDCDRLNFAEIETKLSELGRKAREGKLAIDDLTGGTFTISNGGVYGSLMSTPILNPPQSGILGMHKIQDRPIAVGGKIEIRPMMYLALTYDHRVIDGREAVTFLVRLKECIEDPQRILLDM
ncbi:MAG: 2-oxoglutarate dehydrogenase complex dihydrolipoyllysine-residue succinyltransferase [Rhodospirillaceae bacterium]|nr:2-oxoglutarate dehydrogenase complex dihydrolipoyllysine-residue succinyltransferase [Rhodospirillaceae bacterium]